MYKKILSIIPLSLLIVMALPVNVFAADIVLGNVIVSPSSGFDPSDLGQNEVLNILYSATPAPDNVVATIKNSDGDEVKYLSSNSNGSMPSWDGEYAGRIVEPGNYTVYLVATKTGYTTAYSTQLFSVSYDNVNKPLIINSSVLPTAFDSDFEDAIFEFENTESADITVTIENSNGDHIRSFADYTNDQYSANMIHSLTWDGLNDQGNTVNLGVYTAKIVARNNYGVTVKEITVQVQDLGTSSSSSAHVDNISIRPSSFEPGIDDDLQINFDVNKNLDELQVFAVRGTEEVEIFNDFNVDIDNNYEVNWDGTDDNGDFVEAGSWRIEFRSDFDGVRLVATKTLSIAYNKPFIDDVFVSKKSFDNDLGEFTYLVFRVDSDAIVDVEILEGNRSDDLYIEDMDVEGDLWYAVIWDGDNYDYVDDLDFKLTARNPYNLDIFDSEVVHVDLAEDDISNTRSNITLDFIDPVAYDRSGNLYLYYSLEQAGDVTVTIHKGSSSTGTLVVELLDTTNQSSGDHSITWNGRDKNGNIISNGQYTYKIISKLTGTDTETGTFIVGPVGEVDGASVGTSSSSSSSNSNVSPNVIVDGVNIGGNTGTNLTLCAGFKDVNTSSRYCNAITWAYNKGIIQGYSDGSFKPFLAINRVEALKVVLIANEINLSGNTTGNGNFSDTIAGAWYMPFINTGIQYGIFSGDGGANTARPGDTVNRAEALKFAIEAGRVLGKNYSTSCSFAPYGDVALGVWYSGYVCAAQNYGLFDVYANAFMPGNLTTRGEFLEMLYRLNQAGL